LVSGGHRVSVVVILLVQFQGAQLTYLTTVLM
jgi:hypothetical protein